MKAGRIHPFGPPDAIVIDEITRPIPGKGELIVRVAAAGVGPWDALIREGKSVLQLSLPLILGSDLAGIVDSVGTGVIKFKPGDEVFGVTNKQFCGALYRIAVASAQMVTAKPRSLSFVEAASVPVVAVTAYQMLFDHAQMKAGRAELIHGAAGNVGAYAVQLAKQAELQVFATAGPGDLNYLRARGRDRGELQDRKIRRCRAPRRCGTRHRRRGDAASFIPRFKAGRYPRVVDFAAATACGLSFSVLLGRHHRDLAGYTRGIAR